VKIKNANNKNYNIHPLGPLLHFYRDIQTIPARQQPTASKHDLMLS